MAGVSCCCSGAADMAGENGRWQNRPINGPRQSRSKQGPWSSVGVVVVASVLRSATLKLFAKIQKRGKMAKRDVCTRSDRGGLEQSRDAGFSCTQQPGRKEKSWHH